MKNRICFAAVFAMLTMTASQALAGEPTTESPDNSYQMQPPKMLRGYAKNSGGNGAPDTENPHKSAWEKRVYGGISYGYPTETSDVGFELSSSGDGVDVGSRSLELKSTWGVFGEFDFPMSRYMVFGVRGALKRWEKDFSTSNEKLRTSDPDGNYLLNFNAVFKARYPFPTTAAAIYVGVPFGLSFVFPPSRKNDLAGAPEFETGFTWNAGLLGGFRFLLTEKLGLFAEFGLKHQNIKAPLKEADRAYEFSYTTLGLNGGVVF